METVVLSSTAPLFEILGLSLAGIVVATTALLTCLHYRRSIWRWYASRSQPETIPVPIRHHTIAPLSIVPRPISFPSGPLNSSPTIDITSTSAQPSTDLPTQSVGHGSSEHGLVGINPGIERSNPNAPYSQSPPSARINSEPYAVDQVQEPSPAHILSPDLRLAFNRTQSNIDGYSVRSRFTDEDSILPPEYQSAWGGATH